MGCIGSSIRSGTDSCSLVGKNYQKWSIGWNDCWFLTIIIWDNFIDIEIYSLVPGFIFAMLAIILFSILSNNKKADVK